LAYRLTFNFNSSYNAGAIRGNSSFQGLQTLLIQSAGSGKEAFVGVGDHDAVSKTKTVVVLRQDCVLWTGLELFSIMPSMDGVEVVAFRPFQAYLYSDGSDKHLMQCFLRAQLV
jgi:hypothetical protein